MDFGWRRQKRRTEYSLDIPERKNLDNSILLFEFSSSLQLLVYAVSWAVSELEGSKVS